ncbi:MAG: hypothetical protein WC342_02790 [Methanoregula sp.]|jgi:hypothetical protein
MFPNAEGQAPAQSLGADYYRIADLAPARDFIESFGAPRIAGYPGHEITEKEFAPGKTRETRYDARDCDRYFHERKTTQGLGVCGMCINICPYGRKGQKTDRD